MEFCIPLKLYMKYFDNSYQLDSKFKKKKRNCNSKIIKNYYFDFLEIEKSKSSPNISIRVHIDSIRK